MSEDKPKLKVLDLFSGILIGGFSLGLERTGGFETVAFCEIEEFPRKVLKKHWPKVPCYHDVRELTADRLAADGITPDVICGGFPCQDVSYAGPGTGIDGVRSGLFWDIIRILGQLGDAFEYVILENVAALLTRGVDQVLRALASVGLDAEWHCIPASYVGLRQLRDRVWIVAYPKRNSLQGRSIVSTFRSGDAGKKQLARLVQSSTWPTVSGARDRGTGHGVPNGTHRNKSIGNAVVPQIPELIGHAIIEARALL